mmetsp:Transcript_10701/g.27448  ORF Transcript_10701/g.27448 Transcript_10701/m.27448 type:complete len:321 (-) Transcript_10701:1164-2126(-)
MSFCLLGASPVTSARRAFTTLTVSDNEATSTSSTCPLSLSLPSTSGTAMRIFLAPGYSTNTSDSGRNTKSWRARFSGRAGEGVGTRDGKADAGGGVIVCGGPGADEEGGGADDELGGGCSDCGCGGGCQGAPGGGIPGGGRQAPPGGGIPGGKPIGGLKGRPGGGGSIDGRANGCDGMDDGGGRLAAILFAFAILACSPGGNPGGGWRSLGLEAPSSRCSAVLFSLIVSCTMALISSSVEPKMSGRVPASWIILRLISSSFAFVVVFIFESMASFCSFQRGSIRLMRMCSAIWSIATSSPVMGDTTYLVGSYSWPCPVRR